MVTIAADAIPADAPFQLAQHPRRVHIDALVGERGDDQVNSWPDFYRATAEQPLLARLDDFPMRC